VRGQLVLMESGASLTKVVDLCVWLTSPRRTYFPTNDLINDWGACQWCHLTSVDVRRRLLMMVYCLLPGHWRLYGPVPILRRTYVEAIVEGTPPCTR